MPHDYNQCLSLSTFVVFACTATLTSRTTVSVDRLWAIRFPISYRKRKDRTATLLMFSSWILPTIFGAFMLFGRHGIENFNGKCSIKALMNFEVTIFALATFCFNLLTMIVLYIFITVVIHQQVNYAA